MSLCKTSDPRGRAIFDPRAIMLTILVKVHEIKLHAKYQRPGTSSFRQEDFLGFVFIYRVYVTKYIFQTLLGLHTKPQGHWPFGSREVDFLKGFTIYGIVTILIMWPRCDWLYFNDITLVGHFVSSLREREKRDRRDSRRDEREGQERKRNENESEETEEIKTFPLYPYLL